MKTLLAHKRSRSIFDYSAYIFDRGVGVDAFQASLVSVFLCMSVHFKSSETKTTIDPDKLFEEIAPSL